MLLYVSVSAQYKTGMLKPTALSILISVYLLFGTKAFLLSRRGAFEEISLSKQPSSPTLGEIYRVLLLSDGYEGALSFFTK